MRQAFTVHFVDRDTKTRAEGARLALTLGYHAEVYAGLTEMAKHPPKDGIIVARDDTVPGGVAEILAVLAAMGVWLPVVAASEYVSVCCVVGAVRNGAIDYLQLPMDEGSLAALLERVHASALAEADARRSMVQARAKIAGLSEREREVLTLLVGGGSNKVIARELAISPRTVEIHRANMMDKLGAQHVADAVRLHYDARL